MRFLQLFSVAVLSVSGAVGEQASAEWGHPLTNDLPGRRGPTGPLGPPGPRGPEGKTGTYVRKLHTRWEHAVPVEATAASCRSCAGRASVAAEGAGSHW